MRLTIQRVSAVAAVAAVILVVAPRLLAQGRELPGGYRWSTAAPFPEPQEELYALTVSGKVYIVGGFGKTGDPQGLMYRVRPRSRPVDQEEIDAQAGASPGTSRLPEPDLHIRRLHDAAHWHRSR